MELENENILRVSMRLIKNYKLYHLINKPKYQIIGQVERTIKRDIANVIWTLLFNNCNHSKEEEKKFNIVDSIYNELLDKHNANHIPQHEDYKIYKKTQKNFDYFFKLYDKIIMGQNG